MSKLDQIRALREAQMMSKSPSDKIAEAIASAVARRLHVPPVIAVPDRAGPAICPEPPPGSARSALADTATDAPRPKFNRNVYQRAYMRKRRADLRALRSKES
jgi:hypothetical protein